MTSVILKGKEKNYLFCLQLIVGLLFILLAYISFYSFNLMVFNLKLINYYFLFLVLINYVCFIVYPYNTLNNIFHYLFKVLY